MAGGTLQMTTGFASPRAVTMGAGGGMIITDHWNDTINATLGGSGSPTTRLTASTNSHGGSPPINSAPRSDAYESPVKTSLVPRLRSGGLIVTSSANGGTVALSHASMRPDR